MEEIIVKATPKELMKRVDYVWSYVIRPGFGRWDFEEKGDAVILYIYTKLETLWAKFIFPKWFFYKHVKPILP